MWRFYDKFSEADRRAIRKWQAGIAAFYVAVFFGFLALVVVNHEIGAWATSATQADMTGSKARPASNPARMTSFEINTLYP